MDDDRDPLLGDAGDLSDADLGVLEDDDLADVLGDLDEENPDDFPIDDDNLDG